MIQELAIWQAKYAIPQAAIQELCGMFYHAPEQPWTLPEASESRAQAEIRLAAPPLGTTLMRNNKGACKDETGRLIRYGLGHESPKLDAVWKSSDLVGVTPVYITPAHLNRTLGIATFVEVKKPGWTKPTDDHETAQGLFLSDMARYGALSMFATSAEQYTKAVQTWRNS